MKVQMLVLLMLVPSVAAGTAVVVVPPGEVIEDIQTPNFWTHTVTVLNGSRIVTWQGEGSAVVHVLTRAGNDSIVRAAYAAETVVQAGPVNVDLAAVLAAVAELRVLVHDEGVSTRSQVMQDPDSERFEAVAAALTKLDSALSGQHKDLAEASVQEVREPWGTYALLAAIIGLLLYGQFKQGESKPQAPRERVTRGEDILEG